MNWDLTDNQGTVRDVVQYNGTTTTVVNHLVYGSFGQIYSQSNSAYQPTFTYAGMRYDSISQLCFDCARWYDAGNGVFMSQDPLGFAAGDTNLSRYCGNSPTNYTDPTGEVIGIDDAIIIGALIGLNYWIWGNNAAMADDMSHSRPINLDNSPYHPLTYAEGAATYTAVGAAIPAVGVEALAAGRRRSLFTEREPILERTVSTLRGDRR